MRQVLWALVLCAAFPAAAAADSFCFDFSGAVTTAEGPLHDGGVVSAGDAFVGTVSFAWDGTPAGTAVLGGNAYYPGSQPIFVDYTLSFQGGASIRAGAVTYLETLAAGWSLYDMVPGSPDHPGVFLDDLALWFSCTANGLPTSLGAAAFNPAMVDHGGFIVTAPPGPDDTVFGTRLIGEIDHASARQVVPEPASLLLVAGGLACLFAARRRRSSRAR